MKKSTTHFSKFQRKRKEHQLKNNNKGSALVLTVIVMINALLIVTAIAAISIVERKASTKTKNSTPAFQAADSTMEWVLKQIKTGSATDTIDDICGSFDSITGLCIPDSSFTNNFSGTPTDVKVYFVDDFGAVITVGTESIYSIATIRTIGSYGINNEEKVSRALEASVHSWNCGNTLVDGRDFQSYTTVEIGAQCWMAQNLNLGTFTLSNNTGSAHSDVSDDGTIEKYCYENDSDNCSIYGGLYDWDEAMEYAVPPTEGAQGICPDGWHIPTDGELHALELYLNDDLTSSCDPNRMGSTGCDNAGARLQQGGDSGFEALLGGYRFQDGDFYYIGDAAYFLSSTELLLGTSFFRRILEIGEDGVYRSFPLKQNAVSVRCLKD